MTAPAPDHWTAAQREAARWADASADGADDALDLAIRGDVVSLAAFLPGDDTYAAEKLAKLYVEPLRMVAAQHRRAETEPTRRAGVLEALRTRHYRFWSQVLVAVAGPGAPSGDGAHARHTPL